MDEHVPFAHGRADAARRRCVDGAGRYYQQAEDPAVLNRAMALGRVVFTQDEDFLRESNRRQAASEEFAGVVYSHQLNVTIGQCDADLELIAKVYEPDEMVNRVEVLPL